ncbi:hypothetical protein CDAR_499281 [Caerostris darwini]|uniref:Uncharacterized protein n=1 Tax=Caerostris darwini TaxID=1538125 RepID=A0AAV4NWB7_9ARAC|nr:hypothetical protein CDAR_499281 [Caerostris darwini]
MRIVWPEGEVKKYKAPDFAVDKALQTAYKGVEYRKVNCNCKKCFLGNRLFMNSPPRMNLSPGVRNSGVTCPLPNSNARTGIFTDRLVLLSLHPPFSLQTIVSALYPAG